MKTEIEVKQMAEGIYPIQMFSSSQDDIPEDLNIGRRIGFVHGYGKAQEDSRKEIAELKERISAFLDGAGMSFEEWYKRQ